MSQLSLRKKEGKMKAACLDAEKSKTSIALVSHTDTYQRVEKKSLSSNGPWPRQVLFLCLFVSRSTV